LAKVLILRKGIKGLVIDPWNELDHSRPSNLSETEYISQCLSKIRRFARLHNIHIWLIAHPTKLRKEDNGNYPVPTPYDISGSAHWRNKADNCISIWRDLNDRDTPVQIHVQKVRFKEIGQVGMVELNYDYKSGRYSDIS
jgi:twinkle protein